jgi:septum formation protein
MSLILASRSPRRRELLLLFNIPFAVVTADVDETPLAEEPADAMALRLARAKAEAVYHQKGAGSWVLGGDTVVVLQDQILGKPSHRREAESMLTKLSGRTHRVITALALTGDGFYAEALSQSAVSFCSLSTQQIQNYCAGDEPFDKAGAYGIQGYAGSFIHNLSGSYSGVVGLPLYETRLLLEKAGLT